MSKIHYLNSHLHKFREKSKITIDIENIGALADYNTFGKEDKETPQQTTNENNEEMVNSLDEFLEDDELK